jgi:hypothetical protein
MPILLASVSLGPQRTTGVDTGVTSARIVAASVSTLAAEVAGLRDSLLHRFPPTKPKAASLPDALGIVGAFVGLATLVAGLWQYARAQGVERAKFALSAIEQFEADPIVRNATLMLDWDGRQLGLTPGSGEEPRPVRVTHEMVAAALRTDNLMFTRDEMAIRDTFDHLFLQLGRFEHLIRSRLITSYNVRPYLAYWCHILAGTKIGQLTEYSAAFRSYMSSYGFDDAAKFVARMTAA